MFKIHFLSPKQIIEKKEDLIKQYQENPIGFLSINNEEEVFLILEKAKWFYQNRLKITGQNGYVIGISGGIDSAIVAKLLTNSLGKDAVYGVIIPSEFTEKENIEDALEICQKLKIKHNDYKNILKKFKKTAKLLEEMGEKSNDFQEQQLKYGNIQARIRMIILRDIAKKHKYLVAGTSNASELEMGYFTLAGDGLGGVDDNVLGNLYKTTIFDLGNYLDISKRIIRKIPSPELWPGQTDEKELGISYFELDKILVGKKIGLDYQQVAKINNFDPQRVKKIFKRVEKQRYRSMPPMICKFY